MKTFILLTFGFLGFAFYEMSGGSEFEPASARMANAAPEAPAEIVVVQAAAPQASAIQVADTVNTASIAKISSTPSVTRVALNLTNISDAGEAATQETDRPQARIIDSVETPQIILPSLIATTDNTNGTVASDIRSVSGNRVNVRGGPSTNYGVVSKLSRGTEVRVLEDNGDGWVRMQPLDGGEAGWMADFLLTSG